MPSTWTRPLQIAVGLCSIVFTAGTALHNFVIVDAALIEAMMREAGAENPVGAAPGFTTGFRLIGCLYILGNAVGILALRRRPAWLFWLVLAVNLTQGLGFVMIPAEMRSVAADRYGTIGLLPSLVTDGGAAVLAVVLLIALVRYRTAWAVQLPTSGRGLRVR